MATTGKAIADLSLGIAFVGCVESMNRKDAIEDRLDVYYHKEHELARTHVTGMTGN